MIETDHLLPAQILSGGRGRGTSSACRAGSLAKAV